METGRRQEKIWRFLSRILYPVLRRRFGLEAEPLPAEQPAILVCNHVTDLDPVLLAMASRDHALTYVASEHILRDKPFLRKWLYRFFAPITRRKATSAVDTCRKTVRAVREGKTVCIFAEGETTWNGRTASIQKGTGMLVKAAGVPLITYRLHGGYFAAPRWGKGLRRGKITGQVTGTWPAGDLKAMTAEEINSLIEEGIREDAFAAQRQEKIPVSVSGKRMLEQIDSLLFLCPQCLGIGTLRGRDDLLSCSCGLEVRVDRCMLPVGEAPFPDFSAWDDWQVGELGKMIRKDRLFRLSENRDDLTLTEIDSDDVPKKTDRGSLSMDREALRIGNTVIPAAAISDMATLQNRKLAISASEHYYELQAPEAICLRKYLLFWREIRRCTAEQAEQETYAWIILLQTGDSGN